MKATFQALAVIALGAALSFAQGPKGSRQGTPAAPVHQLDPAQVVVISGTVDAVNIDYAMKHPSIVVQGKTIELGPLFYLTEKGFEVEKGQSVDVKAAPCFDPDNTTLFALEITNRTLGTTLVLRDADGTPLWVSRGSRGMAKGRGNGQGNGGPGNGPAVGGAACFDSASITTVTGTVKSVSMGVGIRMPALVLATPSGDLTIKIGPERILLEAGFTIEAGETLTVKYGKTTCTEELVALVLTATDGSSITLRNDDGTIAW